MCMGSGSVYVVGGCNVQCTEHDRCGLSWPCMQKLLSPCISSAGSVWYVCSKNSGMNFIPIEYDFHPNEFHTYGMNSASMTFIPTAVRSSYRECEKTSVIPKLRVNFTPRCLRWQTALLGQRSSKSMDEKSIYAQKKIYSACKTRHAACMMQQ